MNHRTDRYPLLVLLLGLTALAMLIPAAHALALREHFVSRSFFYSALILGGLALLLALATGRNLRAAGSRGLLPLLGTIYLVLPVAMALPLTEVLPQFRFQDAWFEMVSAFTTTGASLIEAPRRVPESVHLWRAMAGWAGGLFILVSAMAYLAPLRLGGFELLRPWPQDTEGAAPTLSQERQRLRSALAMTLPWYAGVTAAVWLVLASSGMPGLPALILAMSAISTSGILPRESLGAVGFWAELVLLCTMALALSRALTLPMRQTGRLRMAAATVWTDPEIRLGLVAVGAVGLIVMLRHALGAWEVAGGEDFPALGRAAWGAIFTGLSFLTTTGFVGHDWIVARAWSGLTPPGLVLMGLALMGGGVATTAGGVKLLRIFAMARLGRAELNRLIYPSRVDDGTERARFLATRGARAAWLFAMVFAITAVVLIGALMVMGETLESALIFTVAALTTTGPLVEVAGSQVLTWPLLGDPARLLMALAMILGRLEILVILALALAQVSRD